MDKYLICEESKKAKRPILKSSEIVITPLIACEMDKLIERESDEALKAQYINMKDQASKDSDNGIWCTYWDISLKKDEKQSIGGCYFSGPATYGSVTLSFSVDSRYNWDKRVGEALRLITEWALVQTGVYEINTYIPTAKDGYIRNAERADFVYREVKDEIEHYSKERPATSWMGLYILMGIIAGFLLGMVFSSMTLGMASTVIISILIGGIMDQKSSVEREKYTGQKRQPKRIIAKRRKEAAKRQMAEELSNKLADIADKEE